MSSSTRTLPLMAFFALGSLVALPRDAAAAPSWVDRPMTLPSLTFAGDVGFGVGHASANAGSATGVGMNLEAGLGVTSSFELGLRTGARFGVDGRALSADAFGRTLWTETYGTSRDPFANPELRGRWAFFQSRVVEVGLDVRAYMPVEEGSAFGTMVGLPLAIHVGDLLRIDTGVYVPIIYAREFVALTAPAYFWFQVSRSVWLGPMISLRHMDLGGPATDATRTDLLLGFGLGYQVHRAVDLKWMLLAPRVNDGDVRTFGAGFGVQFRLGD